MSDDCLKEVVAVAEAAILSGDQVTLENLASDLLEVYIMCCRESDILLAEDTLKRTWRDK